MIYLHGWFCLSSECFGHLRLCIFSEQVEENSRLKAELERSILELAKYVSIFAYAFLWLKNKYFTKILRIFSLSYGGTSIVCVYYLLFGKSVIYMAVLLLFSILPRNQMNPCSKHLISEITQILPLCPAWFTSQLPGSRV